MNFTKKLKTVLSTVLAGAMLVSTASVFPSSAPLEADAASACNINTNKEYQTIRGFGGMNHPEWQSYNAQNGAPGDMTEAQVQTAFGNGENELGLTILRIFVSDDKNAWKNAIPTAQRAQKLGATVFATPWNPPASMRQNGNGGPTGGQYVLKQGAEAQYAQHLNDFIKYCDSQGVHLNSISVQNEPDYSSEWTYWSPDRCATFLANYGKAVTAGTTTKMMSPETFQYGKSYYNAILNNAKALANCDMFGTHFYGTQRSQMDFPALENSGKEIWMTEVYVPNSDNNSADRWPEGVKVAENIHNALVVGNMNAYVWWYIRRQYSPMWDTGKISKRGYAMAQFSKWVRPGDVRIDATEQPDSNILVSAYKHSDTQISIVAINKGSNEINQSFNVSGRTITNVNRYRTSGSENIAKTLNMNASGSSFNAQLPANSVSTFVVSLVSDGKGFEGGKDPVPPEPIEPDANGYYYHDTFEDDSNGWEGRGGATVTTGGSAYAGSKALTVSDRSSAWHGAMKSLDSLTFKGGQEYSFSVAASGSGNMMLSLEYKNTEGETSYAHIADGVSSGNYVQLSNANYKLPEGSGYILYVETEEGTDNFSIDEAIVAKAGVQIDGPKPVVTTTTTTTKVTTTTTTTTTTAPTVVTQDPKAALEAKVSKWGDANCDGTIDMGDVVLIMQSLANPDKYALSEKAAANADVNQAGGGITTNDALTLQKYLLGLVNTLPESWASSVTNPTVVTTTTKAPEVATTTTTKAPAAEKVYFKSSFDSSTDGWSARGNASIAASSDSYYSGKSLYVSGRTATWNGAAYTLGSDFKAGETYSFSAAVMQQSGSAATIQLSLQQGEGDNATYTSIAKASCKSGEWTKLENTSFTIPDNSGDMILYFETIQDSGDLMDFYIDDVVVASEGTKSSVVTGQGHVGEVKTPEPGKVDTSKKLCAISFDDGASATTTSDPAYRIINALVKNGMTATFFNVGSWIKTNEQIKYEYEKGMEVANHTQTHPHLGQLGSSQIRSEWEQCNSKLKSIIGTEPSHLMRLPFLESNATVLSALNDVPLISCAIDTGDWNNASKDQIVSKIKQAAQNGTLEGAIVLCHENYATTAAAMEEVLPWLAQNGYQNVNISDMAKAHGKTLAGGQVHTKA
ncbi:O-Glycosyl hydrolase [Ruminococcus flavefaciens]|uniref:O-Glycosyl hydrolase n=1 Tax=Ruminococcus flavefaciens TaxID=1265 RepID=A0A1H6LR03_RUMFL|nr:carbohydrate binding domain-containing protein [Ruminococcus flavefaciens]SEH87889.1 O-Glycosyl hydrolase [Ruminococcus flavefaciens]